MQVFDLKKMVENSSWHKKILDYLGRSTYDKHLSMDDILKSLHSLYGRVEIPPFQKYRIRQLYPSSLSRNANLSNVEFIKALLPDILYIYIYIFRRRIEVNKKIEEHEIYILYFAIQLLRKKYGLTSLDVEMVSGYLVDNIPFPKRIYINLILKSRKFLSFNRFVEVFSEESSFLSSIFLKKQPSLPSLGKDSVSDYVIEILSLGRDKELLEIRLCDFFSMYFDPYYGLFVKSSVIERSSGSPSQFYISTLLILMIIHLCEVFDIHIDPFQDHQIDYFPSSSTKAAFAKNLANYIIKTREPPSLPGSLQPQCLIVDSGWRIFEDVRASLDRSILDKFGVNWIISPLRRSSSYICSVRYDVDRSLSKEIFNDIRDFERDLNINSSWFFRRETFEHSIADSLLSQGCEIGLHSSHIETGDSGFAEFLRKRYPSECVGCTFHGGVGSQYWKGYDSLVRCLDLGYTYAEMLTSLFAHPYKFSTSSGEIYLTPLSVKYDAFPEWVEPQMNNIKLIEGHAIIETHPDRFSEKLREFITAVVEDKSDVRTIRQHVATCKSIDNANVALHETSSGLNIEILCDAECQIHISIFKKYSLAGVENAILLNLKEDSDTFTYSFLLEKNSLKRVIRFE